MLLAQPGHIDHIKRKNAGLVYRLIDQLGPISRIELSKRTQLAPASITKITRELVEAHLIQETEIQESGSRGRPAVGLMLNNEGWQFLSIRLGPGYLVLALHELSGAILLQDKFDVPKVSQSEVVALLLNHVQQFFARHTQRIERVTSIAVTVPGLVDHRQGVVVSMPYYGVANLQLGALLHKETGLSVFVGNDIRSWALAEKFFGKAKNSDNAVLVSAHHNIGAGILVDGNVLEGSLGNIGELGHIQVKPFGKRCKCGNSGCLDTVAGLSEVLAEADNLVRQGHDTLLDQNNLTIDSISEAAINGDGLAIKVVSEYGHNLGKAMAILVNLFNPDTIYIDGEFNQARQVLFPAIDESLKAQALPAYSQHLTVESAQLPARTTMAGAALVKRAMYDGFLLIKVLEG
ncbi:ROK family transcriptional regulator [Veronia pacifica]|uniref:Transcriptional regulator n=1 Tax=Veronia pacifica TaxID=1080227 RepID=A0A1C3EPY3_9GAMM|nr:ROK family transcriptional regulator [Veronia pacifica]ODA35259.1 transcriptional regulator [Veronia pacifica]